MKIEDVILPAALVIGGVYLVKNYLVDPAAAAGEWWGQNVVTPAYTGAMYPGTCARGMLEGFGCPTVPPTPAGYLPSNWTWELPGGVMLGLPPGWTPGDFCRASPDSPVCTVVYGSGVI